MKTEKINIEIKADTINPTLTEAIYPVADGLSRGLFNIKINDTVINTAYGCPVLIKGNKVSRKQIIADVVLYCIESAGHYSEFNNFESPDDYQDIADAFGIQKISKITNTVKEIKCFHSELKYLKLCEKETDLIGRYEDDDDEDNMQDVIDLVEKYFNVSFISDYINK